MSKRPKIKNIEQYCTDLQGSSFYCFIDNSSGFEFLKFIIERGNVNWDNHTVIFVLIFSYNNYKQKN